MNILSEMELASKFPEYTQLVVEEFNQWVTYGMLLGFMLSSMDSPAAIAEITWLHQQHDAGRIAATHEALHVLSWPFLPSTAA